MPSKFILSTVCVLYRPSVVRPVQLFNLTSISRSTHGMQIPLFHTVTSDNEFPPKFRHIPSYYILLSSAHASPLYKKSVTSVSICDVITCPVSCIFQTEIGILQREDSSGQELPSTRASGFIPFLLECCKKLTPGNKSLLAESEISKRNFMRNNSCLVT